MRCLVEIEVKISVKDMHIWIGMYDSQFDIDKCQEIKINASVNNITVIIILHNPRL